jgi:hypothetical protein
VSGRRETAAMARATVFILKIGMYSTIYFGRRGMQLTVPGRRVVRKKNNQEGIEDENEG